MTRTLIKAGVLHAKARAWATRLRPLVISGFACSYRRISAGRGILAELAGVVLAAYGISMWSVPSAIIIGGLVLIGIVEVRPPVIKFPSLPPPEEVLRRQAESAAILINNNRFGLAAVDADSLAQLTPAECERLIMAARSLGAPA